MAAAGGLAALRAFLKASPNRLTFSRYIQIRSFREDHVARVGTAVVSRWCERGDLRHRRTLYQRGPVFDCDKYSPESRRWSDR